MRMELPMSRRDPSQGTHAARILLELSKHPEGATDGQLARILNVRHQTVNANCRMLETQGLITRKHVEGVISNRMLEKGLPASPGQASRGDIPAGQVETAAPSGIFFDSELDIELSAEQADTTLVRSWYWEGNVQATTASFLEQQGWTVVRTANTATRERGKDIEATRSGLTLWVTVKGLPVRHPNAQARVWFADAMLDVIRYRQEDAAVSIAVALPESHIYERWRERTLWLQRNAPFDYLWVGEGGEIRYDPGRSLIL
jgi:hypothetical protein